MSELSYMEKLLDGIEVEWKTLSEVCVFINGRAYKRPELLDQGKYPVLRVGNFFTNGNWYYSNLELNEDKYCDNGDLLYAWSASFGPRIWEGGKVIYHYHIWKVIPETEIISKKYLFYLLDWDTEALKAEHGTGSTMMHVGKGAIEKRLVPIPSIKIQAKIVRILDAFTELTAQLTAELVARKQQYTYYRDQLLTFEESKVEWKKLEDVCEKISSGKNKFKSELGLYPVFGSTGIIGRTDAKVYSKEQILVARVGANAGRVNIAKGEYDVSDNTLIVQNKDNIILKFLYYYLVNVNLNRFTKGAGQPLLTAGQLKTMLIPLPPLAEQQRIVAILDKFDALTTSLTEGLPREIELRQQQYEYYRELLLSFPKAEVAKHD